MQLYPVTNDDIEKYWCKLTWRKSPLLHLKVENNIPLLLKYENCQLLLKYNPNCNIQDNSGNTPLHIAVQKNFLDVIQILLQDAVKTNLRDKKYFLTPLELAIKSGYNESLELLLENAVDVNFENKHGDTLLAASCNYYKGFTNNMTRMLLQTGIKINNKNKTGDTALHIVTRNDDASLVKVI